MRHRYSTRKRNRRQPAAEIALAFEVRAAIAEEPVAIGAGIGAGAVDLLLSGRSAALVTRREGQIEPIAFEDLIDAETGRTKVRMVETGSDFYAHALALQDRIRAADLSDAGRLEALAGASEETKARFA